MTKIQKNSMQELIEIQHALNAPKNRHNNFGDFNYRSCEDILEAVKPLLYKHKCQLTLSDKLVPYPPDRYYIEATATLTSATESVSVTALAREPQIPKKKMDESQATGTTSSYARKYALNGLFAIDDAKDADTDEYAKQDTEDAPKAKKTAKAAPKDVSGLSEEIKNEILSANDHNSLLAVWNNHPDLIRDASFGVFIGQRKKELGL